ncbi:glycosyltransferase [Arthrobacter pascens]|uniref:glycosyltransferase n=1 Tax=Arthrobacter pascens TaxID=1677 RepID=UPI0027D7F571|nr:glycosyltransferase [Arthrobacter pascens]
MKYADEVPQLSTVQLAKRRRYLKDIDSLIQDYERLLSHENRSRKRIQALERDLGAMRRARDNAKTELTKVNKERQELKAVLKAIRSSRSFRTGRALGKPLRVLSATRALLNRFAVFSRTYMRGVFAKPHQAQQDAPVPARNVARPAAETSGPAKRKHLSAEFAANPSKGTAIRLVSHDYFDGGAIVEPAEFIQRHSALFMDASESEQSLLQNVLGQRELLIKNQFLTPRQPNPGYTAERNRIMYCAHSTGHFNSNGYSTRTAGIVAGLKADGEDVLVVARPGYPWDSKVDVEIGAAERFELEVSGVPHIFNPGPTWTVDRLDYYLAEAVDVYVREAQRNRVSLIHAASNYVTALPALMAARRLGIPFVYEVRGLWEITDLSTKPGWGETDRYKLALRLETLVAKEADAVLAITSQVRDELIERGVAAEIISLVPNSVDTDAFTPMPPFHPLRGKLGLSEDSVVVGYAGSLVAYEGLADLLSAMKIVVDGGTDVRLVVVGDGKQLVELKRQSVELGIKDRVTFTGRVPAAEVPEYVSLFDIMPCPRRRLPVTEMVSPLKPLEAMASAKALVLSDLGPLRDLAGPNRERALLCEPGNAESLAAAITALACDPERRVTMGRRARLWTINERTWRRAGRNAVEAHQLARNSAVAPTARGLSDLTIGVIADQFTFEGLRAEADLIALEPDTWREQLDSKPLDALFVESAWEGNGGLWKQQVGYYDEERFSALKALLEYCNSRDVPTIFWNKEDPVHFNRFSRTASYFDHVFSTDSNCIRRYKATAGHRQQTVASLPFYAQPRLHNIVPAERPYDHSVAYAGSYYGDRYKSRSDELAKLLSVAKNHGLSIYDRQHLNPDSPYRFPNDLVRFVRGGLEYDEMVEAYKAHPVHINVNSVDDSPTMFSRRVMEIAASGATVVSGKGAGVQQVLNGLVPVVSDGNQADLLVDEWMTNEPARLRDAWLAYRHVHRGHTAAHRLTYALRTAGLQLIAPEAPKYGVFVETLTADVLSVLHMQTVPPAHIYCVRAVVHNDVPFTIVSNAREAELRATAEGHSFLGRPGEHHADRTVFEDLLTATSFGAWNSITFSSEGLDVPGLGLAQLGRGSAESPQLRSLAAKGGQADLCLRRELIVSADRSQASTLPAQRKNVLIAGHDLKFASGLIAELNRRGHRVVLDKWDDHNKHDEVVSQRLLADADTIFCEWTLGNAVWYSKNKLAHQRLVTRIHLQELFRPYLKNVSFDQVDEIVVVGQHILDLGVRDHGVPREIARVVPNAVDIESLRREKTADARFNLGFVGIVPARKRLDKALDVLSQLRNQDKRYRLFIKGKRPEDFPWMASRPEEMAYYEEQYRRIESEPLLAGAVFFDAHGDDMAEWYRKIGVVLSVSDFESFHLTLADGAASGAVPVSLAWAGADQIYPVHWLYSDVEEMAAALGRLADEESWRRTAESAQEYVHAHFDAREVLAELAESILKEPAV